MTYIEKVPKLQISYFTMRKDPNDKLGSRSIRKVNSSLYIIRGTKFIDVNNRELQDFVCFAFKVMHDDHHGICLK